MQGDLIGAICFATRACCVATDMQQRRERCEASFGFLLARNVCTRLCAPAYAAQALSSVRMAIVGASVHVSVRVYTARDDEADFETVLEPALLPVLRIMP